MLIMNLWSDEYDNKAKERQFKPIKVIISLWIDKDRLLAYNVSNLYSKSVRKPAG